MSNHTLTVGALTSEDTALLQPLDIAVGLIVFGLIFFWCHSPFSLPRRVKGSIASSEVFDHSPQVVVTPHHTESYPGIAGVGFSFSRNCPSLQG